MTPAMTEPMTRVPGAMMRAPRVDDGGGREHVVPEESQLLLVRDRGRGARCSDARHRGRDVSGSVLRMVPAEAMGGLRWR